MVALLLYPEDYWLKLLLAREQHVVWNNAKQLPTSYSATRCSMVHDSVGCQTNLYLFSVLHVDLNEKQGSPGCIMWLTMSPQVLSTREKRWIEFGSQVLHASTHMLLAFKATQGVVSDSGPYLDCHIPQWMSWMLCSGLPPTDMFLVPAGCIYGSFYGGAVKWVGFTLQVLLLIIQDRYWETSEMKKFF